MVEMEFSQSVHRRYRDQGISGGEGPQAGSRPSPACSAGRRCTLPSAETAASSDPCRPVVAYMIMLPLGAKLGDSSSLALVRRVMSLVRKSRIPIQYVLRSEERR